MSKYPYRQDREELKELLQQYSNLKNGKRHSFIEEDGFERIVYFDEKEQFNEALSRQIWPLNNTPIPGHS